MIYQNKIYHKPLYRLLRSDSIARHQRACLHESLSIQPRGILLYMWPDSFSAEHDLEFQHCRVRLDEMF